MASHTVLSLIPESDSVSGQRRYRRREAADHHRSHQRQGERVYASGILERQVV
jgi:hypothetical protein